MLPSDAPSAPVNMNTQKSPLLVSAVFETTNNKPKPTSINTREAIGPIPIMVATVAVKAENASVIPSKI